MGASSSSGPRPTQQRHPAGARWVVAWAQRRGRVNAHVFSDACSWRSLCVMILFRVVSLVVVVMCTFGCARVKGGVAGDSSADTTVDAAALDVGSVDVTSEVSSDTATYPDLPDGLVAWFRHDDDPLDGIEPGPGTDETASCFGEADCPFVVPGIIGDAYDFDGSRHFRIVDDGDLSLQAAFSVALWFNAHVLSGTLVHKPRGNIGGIYSLKVAETEITFLTNTGGNLRGLTANNLPLEVGRWYHVAVTWDGASKQVFLNGNLAISQAGQLDAMSNDPVLVGTAGNDDGLSDGFDGRMDDLRIYDRALSSAEVRLLATP